MPGKKEGNSSKKNPDEYRSLITLRGIQIKEFERFEKLGLFTTRADTIRNVVEEGIEAVQKKRGIEPLKVTEI